MAKQDYTNLYVFLAIFGFIVLMFTIIATRNKERFENPEDIHEDFKGVSGRSGSSGSSGSSGGCRLFWPFC